MPTGMLIEDWLRGCVYHDGRQGEVTLRCDRVLAIADYIESTRTKVELLRCRDCKHYENGYCDYIGVFDLEEDFFCANGERKDGEP